MRPVGVARVLVILVAVFVVLAPAQAQGLEYVKANYTKHEYTIPMRDGVRLFTAVYIPKDRSQTYPILLVRTPYSVAPYGEDQYRENVGPSALFGKDGYIVVYQDVRGRWMSEGEFVNMRPQRTAYASPQEIDESTDTYDTVEWLLKNIPGHNGRAGQWGISYPGFYTAAGMINAHPALKAASPQAPIADWFASDDFHHNGALWLPHAFGFFRSFGWPRPAPTTKANAPEMDFGTSDGYAFYFAHTPLSRLNEKYLKGGVPFWNDLMQHDTKDAFWQTRNLRPHLKNIKPAVMTVGGWFDAENLFGALEVYRNVEANSPGAFNVLVMGPWVHGGWASGAGDKLGEVRFDAKTAEFYRENIEFPFFNFYLKDKGKLELPEAFVFETGTNQWRRMETWPPRTAQARALHFHANGKLSFDPPKEASATAFDEYVSDPAKPVPFVADVTFGMKQEYMIADQRFAARRADVVVYQTEPLEEDVTIAGPVTPSLWVSTTGTDADFVVKLIDVYPDRFPDEKGGNSTTLGGYQQLVRGEIMRGKFRNSLEKPEAFVPGQATKVEFAVSDVLHTFRRGHRIMVQVQSTWFPLADLNPGKFMKIPDATPGDFQKTTQRVYRSTTMPSAVKVGLLPQEKPM